MKLNKKTNFYQHIFSWSPWGQEQEELYVVVHNKGTLKRTTPSRDAVEIHYRKKGSEDSSTILFNLAVPRSRVKWVKNTPTNNGGIDVQFKDENDVE